MVTFPTLDEAVLMAYGMRRILPSYGAASPILRIRRINDNQEIDLIAGDEPTVLVVNDGTKRSAVQWATLACYCLWRAGERIWCWHLRCQMVQSTMVPSL